MNVATPAALPYSAASAWVGARPASRELRRPHLDISKYAAQRSNPQNLAAMNGDGSPQSAIHQYVMTASNAYDAEALRLQEADHLRARWAR